VPSTAIKKGEKDMAKAAAKKKAPKAKKFDWGFVDTLGEKYKGYAPLALRLILGISFIIHGYLKLSNMGQAIDMFAQFGFNPAAAFAWAAALAEFVGGLLVLVGFGTRYGALAILATMLVATFKIHIGLYHQKFIGGFELPLVYAFIALALVLWGAGKFSVDNRK
jgi:putative oxidoreductase